MKIIRYCLLIMSILTAFNILFDVFYHHFYLSHLVLSEFVHAFTLSFCVLGIGCMFYVVLKFIESDLC